MDHHPSAVVTADPPIVGHAVYHRRSRQAAPRAASGPCRSGSASGTLTAVRYGRLLRIRQADLAAFGEVLNQRTPTTERGREPQPVPVGAAPE